MEGPSLARIRSMWRREEIKWDYVPSSGNSGGFVTFVILSIKLIGG